jgi:asparagine synthase (glutamine-hydrolysing)
MVFYDLTPGFKEASNGVGALYTDTFLSSIRDGCEFDLFTVPAPWPAVDVEITQLICQSYLLENGIAQSDRLSMGSSIELRMPLVDYRLAEIVVGLRKRHRDVDGDPKAWLRRAMEGIVPDLVLKRPKRPFSPPWREWARAIADRLGAQLADGYLVERGILTPAAGRALADQLSVSRWGVPSSLADCALMLELWCRGMSGAASHGIAELGPDAALTELVTTSAVARGFRSSHSPAVAASFRPH